MRGGRRPGAGRKPAAYTENMSTLLSEGVRSQDWLAIMRMLVVRARDGDMRAAQMLLRFRYGHTNDPAVDHRFLSVIRIIDPGDPESDPDPVAERAAG